MTKEDIGYYSTITLLSSLVGYFAASFVVVELNPLEWTSAARLVFAGGAGFTFAALVRA